MRAVIQRVSHSTVRVDGEVTGAIEAGLVVMVGITHGDGPDDVRYIVEKTVNMRLFPTEGQQGGFERSALEVNAGILLISQFTLYASTRKGRRPSFTAAAPAEVSRPLFEKLFEGFRASGLHIGVGVFAAHMMVELVNDGPATILLDSADRHTPRRQAE